MVGGGTALLAYYAVGCVVLAAYLRSGRIPVRLNFSHVRFRGPLFNDILRVGALRLASVDQVERVAVAVVPNLASAAPIIGVGRFHADGSERVELALLVDDAYQHVGLGRLHLLRTSGHLVLVHWDGGDVLSVELDVSQHVAVAGTR